MKLGEKAATGESSSADFANLFSEAVEVASSEASSSNRPGQFQLGTGCRVAVVGGGPSGSMFSIFLLRALELTETDVRIDIFEPRDFTCTGPAGCNHCGGIVSESLIQMLATEGIALPDHIIQRGIESYVLHTDVGSVTIATPIAEKRIAAVYRGNGPKTATAVGETGFDWFLLDSAQELGARVCRQLVTRVEWGDDGRPTLFGHNGMIGPYDVLVVATGVNSIARQIIGQKGLKLDPPRTVRTFITEFNLGSEQVNAALGDSMHVFLLPLSGLEFAAIIPKGEYATLCMLGHEVDEDLVNRFMNLDEVRESFPDATIPEPVCHCFPRMNVAGARKPYADRLVFIGDAGITRLYKDGIGAAYRTAKAAAHTVATHGFSEAAFAAHFGPACRRISGDNRLGKFVFAATELVKKVPRARLAILTTVRKEQASLGDQPLSGVLWDVFTGSAAYRDILTRSFRPKLWGGLLGSMIFSDSKSKRATSDQ